MPLELRLLDTFAAKVDGVDVEDARWSRRQSTVVVKLLALAPRHRLHQEQIMATLWPGADQDTATNGLHKMVHLARHALEPALRSGSDSRFLVRSDGQLQLTAADGLRIDAVLFEQGATAALRGGDAQTCRGALALYEGDLLPSDRFADWATARREHLRALHLQLLHTLALRFSAAGELAEASQCLQQLLAIEPAHEPAHRDLMSCFVRAGARAQALRQYEHCRAALQSELATEPDAATRALYEQARAGTTPSPPMAIAATTLEHDSSTLAVLPFVNLTGDTQRDYLATGIAESVIRGLSRTLRLRVMAPSTVARYRGREVDPRTVGNELAVGTLLLGRIEPCGDRLAISVELVRTSDGSLLWGERFERPADDLLDVHGSIASSVAVRLGVGDDATALRPTRPRNAAAYEQYLRGRHEWNKRTGAGLLDAIVHFQRAIDTDPAYALAYSGLADCYALTGQYTSTPPHESMPRARAAAERALELDPQLAEAHTSLAFVQFAYAWDFSGAEICFQRAIAISPNYATAHQWQHELYAAQGRGDEQRAAIERAHAIDPLSPIIATEIGWGHYFARDFAAARRHLERTVASSPQFPVGWLVLGMAQLAEDDAEAACETLQHALRLSSQPPFPVVLGALGHALARANRIPAARQQLAALAAIPGQSPATRHAMAMVHLGLGEQVAALEHLDAAVRGRADRVAFLAVDPLLDEVRDEPRFVALLRQIHPGGQVGQKMGRSREGGRESRGRVSP